MVCVRICTNYALRRDDIFKEIEDMKINLDQYKRLRRYYVAKEEKKSRKCKAEPKEQVQVLQPRKRISATVLWQIVIWCLHQKWIKTFDVVDYEKMERVHDLYGGARERARCCTKNTQKSSSLPPLPSLEGVDYVISNISTEAHDHYDTRRNS